MKKILTILLILLITVGCDDSTQSEQPTEHTAEQPDEVEPKPTKPVNELTAEEKVIGTYESKEGADTYRIVLLENGVTEHYYNLQKIDSAEKWEISKEGEIHIQHASGNTLAYRINADGSITYIAFIYRGDRSKEPSETYKKIK